MAEFIIKSSSNEERYIYYDKLNKLCITNRPEKATKFSDEGKAWRVLTNQMPKNKRSGWKVVASALDDNADVKDKKTTQRFRVDIDTSSVPKNNFDWGEFKHNIAELFSEIISYKDNISLQLSQVEGELCDCEHYCEFFKCDAAHGYKLYAMIRERRIKRRYLKDELWKINSILGMSCTDIANGGIDCAFKEVDKQTYVPRVLTELFNNTVQ